MRTRRRTSTYAAATHDTRREHAAQRTRHAAPATRHPPIHTTTTPRPWTRRTGADIDMGVCVCMHACLQAYSNLAAEEQRLLASLQQWQSVQDEAITQLDSVLATTQGSARFGRTSSSRPVSRTTQALSSTLNSSLPMTPRKEGEE